MKKAAIAVLFLAGAVVAAGENGKMGGFGNFISDVQAEDELSESDKDQKEIAGNRPPSSDQGTDGTCRNVASRRSKI